MKNWRRFFFFLEGVLQMRSKKVHFSRPILIEKVSEIVPTLTTILMPMQLAKWI
jgi:hypothetical protein